MTERSSPPPMVSVIIPAYNVERFLDEAVESALAQTYRNLEVLIIDDGSTDGTQVIGEKWTGDPRVRYIRQENAGPAAARNRGVEEARGEYIAFLDSDDLWLPEKTEKQLDLFRQNETLGLVYCLRRCRILDDQGEWMEDKERNRRYAEKEKHYRRGNCFREAVEETFIALPSAMVPANVLRRVGGFDTDLITAEDRHLYARITHDYPVDYVEEPLVILRRHGNNLSWDPGREPHTLEFLRKIAEQYPECSLRRQGWMRGAYARQARISGFDALHDGRMSQARRELWEACKYRPGRLSNWAYLAASFMPRILLKAARALKRCRASGSAP